MDEVSGKGKGFLVLLSLLQVINGLSGVLYALFLRNIVDRAVEGDKQGFLLNAMYFILTIIGQVTLTILSSHFTESARSYLENSFKSRLFSNILNRDFSRVSAVHSGEWLNRLTNDTSVVANGITDIVPGFLGMAVRFISALVMVLIIDWRIAAIMIPAGVLLAIFAYAFRSKLKALHKEVQEKDGLLRIFLQENMASLLLIRSFSEEGTSLEKAEEHMDEHRKSRLRKNRFANLTRLGFQVSMNGMYLSGVIYGGFGILNGAMSYGTLMALTQLIHQLQMPIVYLTGMFPQIFTLTASAERLMEIEEYPKAEANALSVKEAEAFYHDRLKTIGVKDLTYTYYPPTENVSNFSKENMPIAIEGITFEIEKGQCVAFTGHSGCGKSTVLKLMLNIYRPDAGEEYFILNDGTREELCGKWHNLFAYVPQGNFLMNGTIRDIVTFGAPADRENEDKIRRALTMACADKFVYELEEGVDTLLGERGTGLSEGQTQRLALARALFSERPILLLDESTSALDEETEKEVLSNLKSMTDKTILIVTHRPAALEICDKRIDFAGQ